MPSREGESVYEQNKQTNKQTNACVDACTVLVSVADVMKEKKRKRKRKTDFDGRILTENLFYEVSVLSTSLLNLETPM